MAGPSPISPHGSLGPIRQNAGLLSFLAVTGGLLWVLRSRSMARNSLEEKQKKAENIIDRHPDSTMGRSKPERDPYTR
ncbi:hypothetical protein QM012_001373 [Aureobasidium pullulans]|uniref:Uncharacterized protein n=1 Tax=Aureobasidium pullulans TaxID=5580 RepID=A0ABR0TDV6_AURPU